MEKESPISIQEKEMIKSTSGAGFSDWIKLAKQTGNHALINTLRKLDSEPTLSGETNAHHHIHDRLKELGLPRQDCLFIPIQEFLANTEESFGSIPNGDYYFVSIEPGKHLAHAEDQESVVEFIQQYSDKAAEDERNKEIFLTHNGEAVMSGHIIVKDGEIPNKLQGEFTIGNFNAFHRGFSTPEISVSREYRNEWDFRGSLAAEDSDWRTLEEFECFGGVKMSRLEMAERINQAISCIPADNGLTLPGYYEVLFEKVNENHVKPVFIEAVT